MSTETTSEKLPQSAGDGQSDIPLPPTNLPFEDNETLESNRHRIAMNTLISSLQQAWSERNNFFAGGNMFIYFSTAQVRNQDFRGPDFFTVLNIDGSYPRQSWIVWEEDGRYPNMIVELLSPKTAEADLSTKKDIYEQVFRTPDYFVFDPFDPTSLRGWHLDANQRYQPLMPNEQGWLWCQTLEFWLGTWEGTLSRESAVWLRFFDQVGLVLLPEEAAEQRAEQEQYSCIFSWRSGQVSNLPVTRRSVGDQSSITKSGQIGETPPALLGSVLPIAPIVPRQHRENGLLH